MANNQWEYRQEETEKEFTIADLNLFGQDGWELICVDKGIVCRTTSIKDRRGKDRAVHTWPYVYLFKRPVVRRYEYMKDGE